MDDMRASDLPSSAALSYLGDAVHSLYVRRAVTAMGHTKSADLHAAGQTYVNAAAQAAAYERILPLLTEKEADVARRAHNSKHLQRPKHMTISEYRRATALEALLGMLFFTGQTARLDELMAVVLDVSSDE